MTTIPKEYLGHHSYLLTEQKRKSHLNKEKFVEKYRSPQHKKNKGIETLQIEKPIGESGCCTSCT